jgi:hypothetical protein
MRALFEMTSFVLLTVFTMACGTLLFFSVARYVGVWRAYCDHPLVTREQSMFTSDGFFYLNALVCFSSMLCLIFTI